MDDLIDAYSALSKKLCGGMTTKFPDFLLSSDDHAHDEPSLSTLLTLPSESS